MPYRLFLGTSLAIVTSLLTACHREDTTPTPAVAYTTSLLAGQGFLGDNNGQGSAAQFSALAGLAVDPQGVLYAADQGNHRIRRITPQGVVTTYAGSGTVGYVDGPAAAAQFRSVWGIALDAQGTLYVADPEDARIRAISPTGQVSTFAGSGVAGYADGARLSAQFKNPTGVAVDAQGTVYVADNGNFCVRKISPTGQVTTLAGSGQRGYTEGNGRAAQFNSATALTLDSQGTIYVADVTNHCIRKVTAAGVVSTLAGNGTAGYADGTGTAAQFNYPESLLVAPDGILYVSDTGNNCVRAISASGQVSTVVGNAQAPADYVEGTGTAARLSGPFGLAAPSATLLYVNDGSNLRIRQITKK